MATSKRILTFILLFSFFNLQSFAHHPHDMFGRFANHNDVLKYGFDAFRAGRRAEAFAAFEYGAIHNHLPSQWKLARMMQSGVGGRVDDLGAYRLFEKIVSRFEDEAVQITDRPYVSNATISLGDYAMTGISDISGTSIVSDPHLAESYYFRAAALYENGEAQYKLAKLYASSHLGTERIRSAMRWYELACQKGHSLAQSELGNLLFHGKGGEENIIKGLSYLVYASRNNDCWQCRKRLKQALKRATPNQHNLASQIATTLKFESN